MLTLRSDPFALTNRIANPALFELDGPTLRFAVGVPGRKHWWRNPTSDHETTLGLAGRERVVLAHAERHGDAISITGDPTRTHQEQP